MVPLERNRLGSRSGCIREDVGVPPDHLFGYRSDHVGNIEFPGLGCDLRVEQDLEKKIAQFLAQGRGILPPDGLHDLVRFLEKVLAEGGVRLGPVPFASLV